MVQRLNPRDGALPARGDAVSGAPFVGAWKTRHRIGPYEVLRLIGRGGMGEVYAAERMERADGPSQVALKRLRGDLALDSKFVELFEHEAAVHALVSHPNVIRLLEFGRVGEEPVMVLEYVEGVSCRRALQLAKERGLPCPAGGALYVMHEVLRGLEHIHCLTDRSGHRLEVVHRDVTPGNVLVARSGEIKLADFGVVRSRLTSSGTRPGVLKGKLGYMSPEQILGAGLDARSDLFSAGVVLAELLLARRLFQRATDFRLMIANYQCDTGGALETLPRELGEIWDNTLKRTPSDRCASASDLRALILRTAERLGIELGPRELLSWLARLGLVASSSGTFVAQGTHEGVDPPRVAPQSGALPPWRASQPRPLPSVGLGADISCRLTTGISGARAMRLGALVAAVATGRIPQSVSIAPKDADGRPLSSWLPRAIFATAPAFDYSGNQDGDALFCHRIDALALPSFLFEIVRRQRTGLLVLQRGRAVRRVYFSQGEVTFVASTVQRELLGMRLIAGRRATADHVERALDHACRRGLCLGEALVELDLVRPGLVLLELVSQLEDRFLAAGRTKWERVSFFPGRSPGLETPSSCVPTEALVCRLVRESFALDELARALAPFMGQRACRTSCCARGDLEGLDAGEARWLHELGRGRASLEALSAHRLASERLLILRAAFLGISAGVLRFVSFDSPNAGSPSRQW